MANINFTFVDGNAQQEIVDLKDNTTLSQEKERVNKSINIVKNRKFLVNLMPGIRSSLGKNNILNSKIYKKDIKEKQKSSRAFVDAKNTNFNGDVSVFLNPNVIQKTYGLSSTLEDIEKLREKPFVDITIDSNDNKKFNQFKNYTMLVDINGLDSFAGSISVFNRREEALRLLITEKNSKGISASLSTTGESMENFNVNVSKSFECIKTSSGISINESQINAFYDLPNENTTTPFELTTNYKNEVRVVNKSVYFVKVFDSDENKTIKSLFPTPNYYDIKQNSIKPFVDVQLDESDLNFNNSYSKYRYFPSHGTSLDRSIESSVTSITYRGEKD